MVHTRSHCHGLIRLSYTAPAKIVVKGKPAVSKTKAVPRTEKVAKTIPSKRIRSKKITDYLASTKKATSAGTSKLSRVARATSSSVPVPAIMPANVAPPVPPPQPHAENPVVGFGGVPVAVLGPEGPPVAFMNAEVSRERIQTRLLVREMLRSYGQTETSRLLNRIKAPMPTVDQIYEEEVHATWVELGDLHKLPTNDDGLFYMSVPTVDQSFIRLEGNSAPVWTTTYASTVRVLGRA